ncbi:MAG: hypothetical protein KJ574_05085 [Nanoarchaeota archaeon]|nr:hypothetical protein [Nanoarchaeota archaeon]
MKKDAKTKEVKKTTVKIIAILLSLIMIAAFYLFFARKIGVYVFWGVVIVCAIAAYWAIPKFMERINTE